MSPGLSCWDISYQVERFIAYDISQFEEVTFVWKISGPKNPVQISRHSVRVCGKPKEISLTNSNVMLN